MQRKVTRLARVPCIMLALASVAAAQDALPQVDVAVRFDSGWVGPSTTVGVVHQGTIEVPGATWLRLRFATAVLGLTPSDAATPTHVRITSSLDGAHQRLDAAALERWGARSAYFNGSAVHVELIAGPGAAPSRITIESVTAGVPGGGIATICGDADDRLPTVDPRVGRLVPAGCTAWMIDDQRRCFLTAGHCGLAANAVVQFNVPLSDADGNVQHPPPEHQYPVDADSIILSSTGIGDDWAYFGCHPNTDTGLTAYEMQGDAFALAAPPRGTTVTVRVSGFGADDSPPELDHTLQTDTGPLAGVTQSILQYEVDTRSGNSGSPVIDESTGAAIGIHTNGGCFVGGGANRGTSLDHAGLQSALASPLGVCLPKPSVVFGFPDGLPDPLEPSGASIAVAIAGTDRATPIRETATLHVDGGGSFTAFDMPSVGPGLFEASFPSLVCGDTARYYFSVQTIDGVTVTNPVAGAEAPYETIVAAAYDDVFADDFQTDEGWTVQLDPALEQGVWERGVPEGGGDRGDPPVDADGSGACYVTGLADGNNDVDGGWTTVTSPRLDATQGDAHLAFARWFSNGGGEDVLTVELSPDDGASWVIVETVGPSGPGTQGGWIDRSIRVADHVAATTMLRMRITAADVGQASIVEAGLDAVRLMRSAEGFVCTACVADVTQDGLVGVDDVIAVLLAWGPCPRLCVADVDGNGAVDVDDLLAVLTAWGCRV